MGKFSNLLENKGKEIKIGDEVYIIRPLTGKYLGLFMELSQGKQENATYELILASLKQTDQSITLEDVQELPLNTLTKIMEVIAEVNELK